MRSKLNFTSRQVDICNDSNSPHSTTFLFFYPIPGYLILEKNIGGAQVHIQLSISWARPKQNSTRKGNMQFQKVSKKG